MVINRKDFVRELSLRANFTLKDTEVFTDALQDLLEEAVENKTELKIKGLFSLRYHKIPEHVAYDGVNHKKFFLKETYKIIFSLAENIKAKIKL